MGKLYNMIKDKFESLINYQKEQDSNYLESMNFDKLYDVTKDIKYVNYMLTYVNNNARYLFGSYESFKKFLQDNNDVFPKNTSVPIIELKDYGLINAKEYDFPKIFDVIEKTIGEKKADELIEKYKEFIPPMLKEASHPFNDVINEMIEDISEYGYSEEELAEYKESLKFANELLVEKNDEGEVDNLIDKISTSRDNVAKNKLNEFSDKNNLDGEILKSITSKTQSLFFNAKTVEKQDYLANTLKLKPSYSEEYKNKILALDALIKENGLLNEPQFGESDRKEYGFIDYFNKAHELKDLINNHSKLDDFSQKSDNIININRVSKELKEIVNKYDKVIDFIKENFDINDISLPANVYSGRKFDYSKDGLDLFVPNLPERWDNKLAPYGVILNGFCQLKGNCDLANVSLEEYLNDPVKCFLKGVKNKFDQEDAQYLLNSDSLLGKRIAHALIMDENAYLKNLMDCGIYNRGIEFINATADKDDNMINNMIINQAGIGLLQTFNHASNILFNENDYDSIKNLFALGNETDNLFSVSNKYFDENMKRNNLAKTYDNKIASFKNVSPLNESRRIMDTLKNFMVERKYIYDNKENIFNKSIKLQEPFKPGNLFVAAKLYFNDYIYKNNINILALEKKEREEVLDFLNDPVGAFEKKYAKEENLIFNKVGNRQVESFASLKVEFKQNFSKLYNEKGNEYLAKFREINNKEGNLNQGKSIPTIINDNKRSFIRRFFTSSSREYRALTSAVNAATDENSATFGDWSGAKTYAIKYLAHKLPQGVDINNLSANEKRRVEFCNTIIKTCDEIEKEKTLENNDISFIAKDNPEFQNQLKKELDLEMENDLVIDTNGLNNEINKEIE